MDKQILTLCDKCAELMQSGGFTVQRISGGSIRIPLRGKKCENCGQTFGVFHRYSVSKKKGGLLDE